MQSSSLLSGLLLLQYSVWLLALLQFILAMYVVVLNTWQQPTVRRAAYYLATALMILAIHTFGVGGLAGASNIAQAVFPTILLAISGPSLSAALFLGSVSLLRFDLLHPTSVVSRRKHLASTILRWGLYILILLPLLFTLVDLLLGRFSVVTNGMPLRLWYTGLDPNMAYSGGYLHREAYASGGIFEPLFVIVHFIILNLATLGFLIYEALLDAIPKLGSRSSHGVISKPNRDRRTLTRLLLVTFLPGLAISLVSSTLIGMIYVLASNILLTITYAYAIFKHLTVTSSSYLERSAEEPAIPVGQVTATTEKTAGLSAAAPAGVDSYTAADSSTYRQATGASLQTRLISATIVVVLPLLAAMGIMLTRQAQRQLELSAAQTLTQLNQSLGEQVLQWLDSSQLALQNVAASPSIRSMDPNLQQSILESTALTYPDFYLISTLDLQGMNLARSDRQPARDYSSQGWFQEAALIGKEIYRPMVGKDIWKPDVVIITPIQSGTDGLIVGYLMALSTLDQVSTHFQETRLGEQGFALLVDEQNRLLAHPDWAQEFIQTQYGLQDMNNHPPVAALPAMDSPDAEATELGAMGMFRFSDANGDTWQAALRRLENGWGLIVQQREDELLAPIAAFQRIAGIVLVAGAAMLIPLMLLTVRNSLRPVQQLTETARAIAAGNLGQMVPLEIASEPGEIGLLASTFNNMTLQLRQLIGGLEQRVADRTQAVERRAIQLQVTAEVAREAASIRDPEELLRNIANLISERFGFYHTGLFLVQRGTSIEDTQGDEAASGGGYAILQAASSEGGQRMLARHHRLKIGPTGSGVGIVGYVAHAGQPRIALDVGSDAVFFNNPDLPLTRSEMALPLMVAAADGQKRSTQKKAVRRVIGVLDVQSTQEAAFGQEDIEILQILADQIAVALENARLLSESRQALEQLQQIYGERIRQSWQNRLRRSRALSDAQGQGSEAIPEITYTFDSSRLRSVTALQTSALPESLSGDEATRQGEKQNGIPASGGPSVYRLTAPIELRGQKLGQLVLQRDRPWSREELELIRGTMDQVALAVENARLLEDIQQRAFQEELVSQMVAQTQRSLDLETVMRSVIQEIAQAMPVERIQLQLAGRPSSSAQAKDTPPTDGGGENASIS